MAVYIDSPKRYPKAQINPKAAFYGLVWSHLWADDREELHAFARRIGLKRDWFQNRPRFPHYDATPAKFQLALVAGATYTTIEDWLRDHPEAVEPTPDIPTQAGLL